VPQNDFSGPREYRGTVPRDPRNPPRFGQLIETVKDAFAAELYRFFESNTDDIRAKLGEFPAIEKFAIGAGSTSTSMETVMNLIMSYGNTFDKYPMIAITSANDKEFVLGLGSTIVCDGQVAPRLTAGNEGPFNLQDGWTLRIRTWPLGLAEDPVETTILLKDLLFSDIGNATVQDLVQAYNAQALYTQARQSGDGFFQIVAGGPCAQGAKNGLEIIGGTPDCLLALGYSVGQIDLYTDHTSGLKSPVQRYGVAGRMTINLDVISDDLNTRTQLADLVRSFFTFYVDRQYFQFQGRSYLDDSIDPPEWYQIILDRKFSWSGEYQRARQGGEQKSYLYSIRGSVPVTAADFIDRPVNRGNATFVQPQNVIQVDAQSDELPTGDYFGVNYLKLGR
jgi:hypothetical protein